MKRVVRHVMIDRCYNLSENWVKAKVIGSQMCKNLFDDGKSEQLLVEISGGERVWVAFWKDLTSTE